MIILGINGFPDGGHDASACIVRDGEVLVFAEEERFLRAKHAYDIFPHAAMKHCLAYTGIRLDEIDYVAFGWDLPRLYEAHGHNWHIKEPEFMAELFPKTLFNYTRIPACIFIDHHLAHAASAFWASGFKQSSVLIMDGQGENASTTLAYADQQYGIKILRQIDRAMSLGYLYKAASGYIGLGRENPGKTMGLAAYGNSVYSFDLLELLPGTYSFKELDGISKNQIIGSLDEMEPVVKWWHGYFERLGVSPAFVSQSWDITKGKWLISHPDIMTYVDFAASIQQCVDQAACHLAAELLKETGCPFLSMAGGVALNCSMNGVIARMDEVKDCFIFPAAHDSGTSLGAAWEVSFQKGVMPKTKRWQTCYLGPEFSNQQVRDLLSNLGIRYREYDDSGLHAQVADLLCDGKITAIFRGRSEIGPRALGNRSIIASPASLAIRDRVNREKGRELWRPLCPSALAQYASMYFYRAEKGSSFMLRAMEVKPETKDSISGVVHVDGTARVQMVDEHSDFGQLISAFHNKSGLPMVLNTSFNLAGEPIVSSPLDALRSFFTSGMDALVLGNFLISK